MKSSNMVPVKLIKQIELGPRQMTFGFENQGSKNCDTIFSTVKREYQANGPVLIAHLSSLPALLENLTPTQILQSIFWLAEEMKIHFFLKDHTISPQQAKQVLVKKPDTPVRVVVNRQVDKHTFEQAKKMSASFLPAPPDQTDQYTFSRLIIREFQTWQDKMISYTPLAEQRCFPGGKEIKNGLILLKNVLEKQDSHSMILSCLKYQTRIIQLAETILLLTEFYSQKAAFWQTFVGQMTAFKTDLGEIKKNKQIFSTYNRLLEIMTSPSPYQLVAEAEDLLAGVQNYHLKIQRKKMKTLRSDALAKITKMIKKLSGLFETFDSDQEYRNQCLYELRALKAKIEKSSCIEDIISLSDDAKDLFVDVIEEI
ncbi:MAG: hypothetical protein MI862_29380 [Desulfobacterales bacterium]|nr:hypothetical protein [Desulfobacterales bacterium]